MQKVFLQYSHIIAENKHTHCKIRINISCVSNCVCLYMGSSRQKASRPTGSWPHGSSPRLMEALLQREALLNGPIVLQGEAGGSDGVEG